MYIHILDFLTMLINILCTFLLAGLCTIGWPVGILGLIMSSILFYISGLYADAILQIVLLASFSYSWYKWKSNKVTARSQTYRLKSIHWVKIVLCILILVFIVSKLLISFTDSTTPYLDSFTSICSLTCVFLASRKIIDNWLIWIVVDSLYVLLYLYKGLPFATITTVVYLIIAIYGYKHWKQLLVEV